MNVVLFGATGSIGAAIAEELVARGHQVKGITRSGSAPGRARAGIELERGDATDAAGVAGWVQGYDAVVSAIGPAFGSGEPQQFVAAAHGLVEGVRTAGVARLLVVGGAGSLELAPGVQAVDQPGFPEAYKANALAQREALEFYRTVDDLDWTYVSPAAEIGPGAHIGDYQLGHHRMLFAEDGSSHISYADFADAVVDCLEQDTHRRERIAVAD
jgi:putative NADH-flavin reductase